MDQTEIILNLWYVADEIGYIYSLRARPYIFTGTDEEKLAFLQKFASQDYLIAQSFSIPKQFHIQGMAVYHKSAYDVIENRIGLFEDAIQHLQSALPAQTKYDIPDHPLVCITPLVGDDNGNIVPQIGGN